MRLEEQRDSESEAGQSNEASSEALEKTIGHQYL
jgi:hypothetical protein